MCRRSVNTLFSRGTSVYDEWTMHQVVVKQVGTSTDLFSLRKDVGWVRLYSLRCVAVPLGVDVLAHFWPHELLRAFPPLTLIPPSLSRVREHGHALILLAEVRNALGGGDISASADAALAAPAAPGPAIADKKVGLSSAPRAPAAVGLAPEWLNLATGDFHHTKSSIFFYQVFV